jgi:methionyl-tRNA formyltransferase
VKPKDSIELIEPLSSIDLVITIGYGVILPAEVLSVPRYGFINLHFSLLPAWRGAAPVQRAIEHGDAISGVTVFALDAGMDTGPVYLQKEVSISSSSNSGDVIENMSKEGPSVIARALEMIEEGVSPTAQSPTGASLARKISKSEAKIDWSQDVAMVVRKIRAFSPEPGAWTMWRGQRLQIARAHTSTADRSLKSGEIFFDGTTLLVGCGDTSLLELNELQPSGKRRMPAQDWANGARLHDGEFFD